MKLQNAIKRVSKFAELKNNGAIYYAKINNCILEFMRNGRAEDNHDITCIRVRAESDKDDIMTDYCAGAWYPNLTRAIKSIQGR